jgi:uncharacterized lipoprotein YddW (UPF0748 family)
LPAPEDGKVLLLDGKNLDWATQNLHAGERARFVATGRRQPVTEAATEKIAAFVSPVDPEARAYELSLLVEVARNYKVDAIVFDRMRYANLFNDYGDRMRVAFEKWLGKTVGRWPEDLLQFDPIPGEPPRRGPLFKVWLEFRAKVIHDFLREATESLRSMRPDLQFGVYVGSWFTEYYGVGVNWGSEKFPVRLSWASPGYNEAGYAELLDWVSTGCYYPIATREDARAAKKYEGGTVEAAAELSVVAVQNASPVYAGLYALDYVGRPDAFAKAVETAARRSQGVMIFDLSYIYDYGWWNILEKAFSEPAVAPHRLSNITRQLREAEDASRSGPGAGGDAALPAVPFKPGGG